MTNFFSHDFQGFSQAPHPPPVHRQLQTREGRGDCVSWGCCQQKRKQQQPY